MSGPADQQWVLGFGLGAERPRAVDRFISRRCDQATIGTPVCAEALATAMSPWKSWEHSPMTPIGHMNNGVGRCMSNNDTDRSRSDAPTSMRGHDAVAGECLIVGALRVLVAGATGDVGEHPRGQHLGSRALQRREIDRIVRRPTLEPVEVDVELVVAALFLGHGPSSSNPSPIAPVC